jgi:Lar family restriction alleviation protein
MATELKPCPFCGGEAALGGGPDGAFVNCTDCLASTNVLHPHGDTDDEAIAAWNTRHKEAN